MRAIDALLSFFMRHAKWLSLVTFIVVVIAWLMFFASRAHAQSVVKLTNDDLHKRHAIVAPVTAAILHGFATRQVRFPATFPPVDQRYTTTARTPSDGPWDWPVPRPERRLDGTLLTDPLTIYGGRYRTRVPERKQGRR